MKAVEVYKFHECCGSTGLLLTAHTATRRIFSTARKMLQFLSPLHMLLIHKSTCQLFSKTALLSACAWTNLTSLSLQKINLSRVSLGGSKQQSNSVFLWSSWKSSCTMFVLCKAALNESRRTATPWYLTLGWVLFLGCCETWRQQERGNSKKWGVVKFLYKAFTYMSKNLPQASAPNINTDPGLGCSADSLLLIPLIAHPPFRTTNRPLSSLPEVKL